MRRSFACFVGSALVLLGVAGMVGVAAETASKEVEVNGVRLPYVEQGSGTPVVLVHAALSDLRDWEAVREALARNHRVVAYTQRYHGTAPWPDDGRSFSAATHADDLAAFISALDAGPVHLVGWSYGGSVAAVAATNNPRLVRSLVLYEPNLASVLAPERGGQAGGRRSGADVRPRRRGEQGRRQCAGGLPSGRGGAAASAG
jgi:pimeloyl-ACP methyl ester carboxylesterase